MKKNTVEIGFSIHTSAQEVIEYNASEFFSKAHEVRDARRKALRLGLITASNDKVAITNKGWDLLVLDSRKLEDNACKYLKKTFVSASDEGHDKYNDLVGTLSVDKSSLKQLEELLVGVNERIDFNDQSYGSFALVAFSGVSDFGRHLLDGAIKFSGVKYDEIEGWIAAIKPAKKSTAFSQYRVYRGVAIEKVFPSGLYSYLSHAEGRYVKYDSLKDLKDQIDSEIDS